VERQIYNMGWIRDILRLYAVEAMLKLRGCRGRAVADTENLERIEEQLQPVQKKGYEDFHETEGVFR